jgi:hypothetical protein
VRNDDADNDDAGNHDADNTDNDGTDDLPGAVSRPRTLIGPNLALFRPSRKRDAKSRLAPIRGLVFDRATCPPGRLVPTRSEIEIALRRLAPRIPPHEFGAVVDHAVHSRGLKTGVPETAAWLSLVAYARHVFTDYDDLLDQGYDRDSARFFVAGAIEAALGEWGVKRRLVAED